MMRGMIKTYCLIGLGDVKGVANLLTEVSETDVAYLSGSGLLIATFSSAFSILEIENLLKEEEKSYIIFEMTPGFYSADIKDKKFQDTLFGGEIDNSQFHKNIMDSASSIMDIMNGKVNDEDYIIETEIPDPDMDDILDRISDVGYENITDKEKKLLKKYSENK